MRYLKNKIKSYLRSIFTIESKLNEKWILLQQEINKLQNVSDKKIELAQKLIQNQFAALQVLDVDYQGTGKIIIITSIGKEDKIKIINIKRHMYQKEWIDMVNKLTQTFGASPVYLDIPIQAIDEFKDNLI